MADVESGSVLGVGLPAEGPRHGEGVCGGGLAWELLEVVEGVIDGVDLGILELSIAPPYLSEP